MLFEGANAGLKRCIAYMQPSALGNKVTIQVKVFHSLPDCYVTRRKQPQRLLQAVQLLLRPQVNKTLQGTQRNGNLNEGLPQPLGLL